jgi:uncharacterized protein (TIGR00255 family)
MALSMTGFARVEANHDLGDLTWEVRAVNHRFLDAQFKLPEDFRRLEPELRQTLSARLRRGKVDCTLRFRAAVEDSRETRINGAALEALFGHIERLRGVHTELQPPSVLDVLRWPGVLEEPEQDIGALLVAAAELFASALENLEHTRRSEGARLGAALLSRCDRIETALAELQKQLPEVNAAVRHKLTERIAQLGVEADPQRLEQELAILAQKSDVSEELDRLASHVSEVRAVLAKSEPIGRRLDFLMQELNREANTLSAKSPDTGITRIAVDIKVAIEQMREQVQNIE